MLGYPIKNQSIHLMHVPTKNRHQHLKQHNLLRGKGVLTVFSLQRTPQENGGSLRASGFLP